MNSRREITTSVEEISMWCSVFGHSGIPIVIALQMLCRNVEAETFWTQGEIINRHIRVDSHAHAGLKLQIIPVTMEYRSLHSIILQSNKESTHFPVIFGITTSMRIQSRPNSLELHHNVDVIFSFSLISTIDIFTLPAFLPY